ncbi:hypothetical protein [Kutzneria chonburiensis]|uniref:Uncharacterized protein n=1 Tax=Kutzneria chonburiensis TaxID=1483604 RepID=A0ABV6MTQ6_9PSEU|nr:hypothetical protein [Kutzneria chonburiensis]
MTTMDPLLPVLAGLVVDAVWFLDSCGDDEVNPDSAVTIAEGVAGTLHALPADQLARFLDALADLAAAEPNPARRTYLESFPFSCGLVEDQPG